MNWGAHIGGKFMFKKNALQDFLSGLKAGISTNESTEFIVVHVIYNQAYTYKFQLKTTIIHCTANVYTQTADTQFFSYAILTHENM